jgi:hypothetical protein
LEGGDTGRGNVDAIKQTLWTLTFVALIGAFLTAVKARKDTSENPDFLGDQVSDS